MKILFLTPWYPDENPNNGVFIRDQVLLLSREHEVRVVASKVDYKNFGLSSLRRSESTYRGIIETRLVVKQSLPLLNQLNYFFRILKETLKIARTFKPDIIHGNIGYAGGVWSWLLSRNIGVPFIITEHTRITNNFRSGIHKFLTIKSLKRAAAVIAVSAWHSKELAQYTGRDIDVLPNVINFEKFPKVRVLPFNDVYHVGFLGGMDTPVKGLDVLLRAIAPIERPYFLHIGGRGKLLEHYKQLAIELKIADKCKFYGFVPHHEVPLFLEKIHFFISASRFETFGIAMVEALACGVPVVATDNGGSSEFINRQNGIIVPVEDSTELKKGIDQMMQNYAGYNPLIIRNTVILKYTAEEFLAKINAVYSRVV